MGSSLIVYLSFRLLVYQTSGILVKEAIQNMVAMHCRRESVPPILSDIYTTKLFTFTFTFTTLLYFYFLCDHREGVPVAVWLIRWHVYRLL